MQRIFIALEVDKAIAKNLITAGRKLTSKLSSEISWQTQEDMHITLVPPFYVDDNGIAETAKILSEFHHESFQVCLNQVGFGPDIKNPFLVWAQIKLEKELTNLRNKLEKALNIKVDERDFSPHITLARLKDGAGLISKEVNLSEEVNLCFEAEAILLMESIKGGPNKYDILQRVELE